MDDDITKEKEDTNEGRASTTSVENIDEGRVDSTPSAPLEDTLEEKNVNQYFDAQDEDIGCHKSVYSWSSSTHTGGEKIKEDRWSFSNQERCWEKERRQMNMRKVKCQK